MVHATSAALPEVQATVISGPRADTPSQTSTPPAILGTRQFRKQQRHTIARQKVIQEKRAIYHLPRDDKKGSNATDALQARNELYGCCETH